VNSEKRERERQEKDRQTERRTHRERARAKEREREREKKKERERERESRNGARGDIVAGASTTNVTAATVPRPGVISLPHSQPEPRPSTHRRAGHRDVAWLRSLRSDVGLRRKESLRDDYIDDRAFSNAIAPTRGMPRPPCPPQERDKETQKES